MGQVLGTLSSNTVRPTVSTASKGGTILSDTRDNHAGSRDVLHIKPPHVKVPSASNTVTTTPAPESKKIKSLLSFFSRTQTLSFGHDSHGQTVTQTVTQPDGDCDRRTKNRLCRIRLRCTQGSDTELPSLAQPRTPPNGKRTDHLKVDLSDRGSIVTADTIHSTNIEEEEEDDVICDLKRERDLGQFKSRVPKSLSCYNLKGSLISDDVNFISAVTRSDCEIDPISVSSGIGEEEEESVSDYDDDHPTCMSAQPPPIPPIRIFSRSSHRSRLCPNGDDHEEETERESSPAFIDESEEEDNNPFCSRKPNLNSNQENRHFFPQTLDAVKPIHIQSSCGSAFESNSDSSNSSSSGSSTARPLTAESSTSTGTFCSAKGVTSSVTPAPVDSTSNHRVPLGCTSSRDNITPSPVEDKCTSVNQVFKHPLIFQPRVGSSSSNRSQSSSTTSIVKPQVTMPMDLTSSSTVTGREVRATGHRQAPPPPPPRSDSESDSSTPRPSVHLLSSPDSPDITTSHITHSSRSAMSSSSHPVSSGHIMTTSLTQPSSFTHPHPPTIMINSWNEQTTGPPINAVPPMMNGVHAPHHHPHVHLVQTHSSTPNLNNSNSSSSSHEIIATSGGAVVTQHHPTLVSNGAHHGFTHKGQVHGQTVMVPKSGVKENRSVIQASTSDLLRAISSFLDREFVSPLLLSNCKSNNNNSKPQEVVDVVQWLRSVDRSLLVQGWQDVAFISPSNLVFLFLLLKDGMHQLSPYENLHQIRCSVLSCLYLAYSYEGNEISYPLKPFLLDGDSRELFFGRVLSLIKSTSGQMLRINSDPNLFTKVFTDLLSYSPPAPSLPAIPPLLPAHSNAFHATRRMPLPNSNVVHPMMKHPMPMSTNQMHHHLQQQQQQPQHHIPSNHHHPHHQHHTFHSHSMDASSPHSMSITGGKGSSSNNSSIRCHNLVNHHLSHLNDDFNLNNGHSNLKYGSLSHPLSSTNTISTASSGIPTSNGTSLNHNHHQTSRAIPISANI